MDRLKAKVILKADVQWSKFEHILMEKSTKHFTYVYMYALSIYTKQIDVSLKKQPIVFNIFSIIQISNTINKNSTYHKRAISNKNNITSTFS